MHPKTFAAFLILISASIAFGAQAESEWVKFTSAEGRFSVQLPRQPKFEEVADPETKKVTNYRFSDVEPGYGFICEYFDTESAPTDVQKFLDLARDGIVQGAGATKVGEEKISLDGYPGRELELSFPVSGGAATMAARTSFSSWASVCTAPVMCTSKVRTPRLFRQLRQSSSRPLR